MNPTITFDFHNTLVECDEWFRIEVHTLVSDVLRYWQDIGEIEVPASMLDRADHEYRAVRRAIHGHGHELPANRAVRTILERIGFALSWDAIDIALDAIMRSALASAKPVEGAAETIELLAQRGVGLGVVSSAVHHEFLVWSLERFGILDRFECIVTSASCGFYKSRPEIYLAALDALAAPPSDSLHVGDSLRFDVGGASRVGMSTAWLRRAQDPPIGSTDPVPDLILSTLTGSAPKLLEIVDQR